MRTLKDSELIVSFFPKFAYDARGGGGLSDGSVMDDGRVGVKFDIESLNIPDVYYKTASFVGVPIVPGLRIAILPSSLEVCQFTRTSDGCLVRAAGKHEHIDVGMDQQKYG